MLRNIGLSIPARTRGEEEEWRRAEGGRGILSRRHISPLIPFPRSVSLQGPCINDVLSEIEGVEDSDDKLGECDTAIGGQRGKLNHFGRLLWKQTGRKGRALRRGALVFPSCKRER